MSALAALGVAPENPVFPAVVPCPLCQKNALHLFDDIVTEGIWLHCNACLTHGDIITFGAQIWNISLPAALTKFSDLGIIPAVEADNRAGEYGRSFTRQQTADDFWRETSSQLWNHGDDLIACRLHEFNVQRDVSGADNLVGVTHYDQLSNLCSSLGRAKPRAIKAPSSSIVFPYYTLPGRIAGFMFVQPGENFELRRAYVPITGGTRRKPDAGYFMLHTLFSPAAEALKNKQFIVEDPLWVLTEQCRQLKYGLEFLPLVASYVGQEAVSFGVAWPAMGSAVRMFQGALITPELISQAAAARGYVCKQGLTQTGRKHHQYTLQQLASIHTAADTWQNTLRKTLKEYAEITAYSFATRLTVPHEKLQVFFRNYEKDFSKDFAQRVVRVLEVAPAAPTRVHNKWTLIEQDNSWYNRSGVQVCNAKIVITKIIQADDGDKFYAGKIFLHDWEFEFVDSARKIEKVGLLAYAQAIAAPHGKIITYDRGWNFRAYLLSLQLYPPELVLTSTKNGWDEQAGLFRFGSYTLTNTGDVNYGLNPVEPKNKIQFPEPALVAPLDIRQFLTPGPASAFVWNVFAAIAANLIAPIVRKDPTATALPENIFDIAAKIGAVLNCQHKQTTSICRGRVSDFVRNQSQTDWPIFISSTFDPTLATAGITKAHTAPLLLCLPEKGAAVALSYGWQRITTTAAPPITTDFSSLRYVLPAYIQRALRSRMRLTSQPGAIALAVLKDLHAWLQDTYGETFHLPQALRQFHTQNDAAAACMETVIGFISDEKLDVLPRPRRKDQPKNYILRQKEFWWLNKRAIDSCCVNCKNIPPNWLTIIDLMIKAGVYGGDRAVQGMPGLLARTDWCDQFWKDPNTVARDIG